MWRLEPRDMGEERIEVNVPDFTLRVLRGQEELHQARIIVGKPDSQTPIFSNAMRYILVNPSWSVPVSIIKKEMMPKLAQDPDYLKNLGFEVTQHGDMISVKQPPGEKNALGRIAFMFPNEHSVYLHDTPSRGLFSSSRRAFSHGCVRVDQPLRLAEIVMGSGWSEQRFRSLLGDTERTVFLPRPLPIHIEYFTAFVDDDGGLQLRDDLYGHMRRIESALGLDVQRG
jgi:L,D-transpeptidase YcbB